MALAGGERKLQRVHRVGLRHDRHRIAGAERNQEAHVVGQQLLDDRDGFRRHVFVVVEGQFQRVAVGTDLDALGVDEFHAMLQRALDGDAGRRAWAGQRSADADDDFLAFGEGASVLESGSEPGGGRRQQASARNRHALSVCICHDRFPLWRFVLGARGTVPRVDPASLLLQASVWLH